MVAAGRLGRKSGRGWYVYEEGKPHRPEDPAPAAAPDPAERGLVIIAGFLPVADELRHLAAQAGWDVDEEADGDVPHLIVECGPPDPESPPLQGAPRAVLCAEGALHAIDPDGSSVGFHALPPVGMVELTRTAATSAVAEQRAEAFFQSLGRPTVWVQDAPGLVLGRIVAQLVNEAAFALGEGVGDVADIDAGMELGLNHPRGPLAWADLAGLDHIVMILDGLREEYGEERYRVAPLLRRIPFFRDDEEHDHGHDHAV
jgi:3-hydroxybutyryl-CoA dehydrogenase